jgi:protein-tyrosine phosphatase
MEGAVRMIDLHIHILPGLDDGARTMEESINMCRASYRDGVRTIVATPHTLNGSYLNPREIILDKVGELNEAVKQFRIQNSEFGIKTPEPSVEPHGIIHSAIRTPHSELSFRVLPGADVHFSPDLIQLFEKGEIESVNDKRQALMIEFPFQGIPYRAEEVVFKLIARGILPIITHPERNFEIGRKPKRYYELIRMGCLGQVTAMSLTGGFGPEIKRAAEELLRHRLIHFIASDAHSANGRPPHLSSGVKEASKTVGGEEAWKMVTEYPQAILAGRRPQVPEPVPLREK